MTILRLLYAIFTNKKKRPVYFDQKEQHEIRLLVSHGYSPEGVARMYQVDIETIKSITA